jgi:hypothetical protein
VTPSCGLRGGSKLSFFLRYLVCIVGAGWGIKGIAPRLPSMLRDLRRDVMMMGDQH